MYMERPGVYDESHRGGAVGTDEECFGVQAQLASLKSTHEETAIGVGQCHQKHGAALPPVPHIDFLPCFCGPQLEILRSSSSRLLSPEQQQQTESGLADEARELQVCPSTSY